MAKEQNGNFEAQLFKAADKLRKNIDAAEYKNVALGLIFLKYISESFQELYDKLAQDEFSDPEDRDEYKAENIFFVPEQARWKNLQAKAKLPTIGQELDDAMESIEKENPELRNVLPKVFGKPNLDKTSLGQLIDLISNTELKATSESSKDLFGRVYEYFLGEFANAEGKKGGQFYTPKSIVKLMVEMIEPYKGRVYDPACGSGGMFVMSEKFVSEHQGNIKDITIYGQESNQTTWKLSKMNLAIRNINSQFVAWNTEGSFLKDAHPDLKADYILANPPFNQSDWGQEILQDDARWKYGVPPNGNANFAWMQHMLYHLVTNGVMATVLANGSLSSNTSGEGDIRKNLIENDLVECIVALPKQLFYNTGIPACIWFLRRERQARKNEILFIDASEMGFLKDRVHREFTDEDMDKISETYHNWRKNPDKYEDIDNYCKSATIEEIANHNFSLVPSKYTSKKNIIDNGLEFLENLKIINKHIAKSTQKEKDKFLQISKELNIFFSSLNWDNLNFSSNAVLKTLVDFVFNEWFGKYDLNDELPEGWVVSKLGNEFDISIGRTPPRAESQWFSNTPTGKKWISIKDIGNSGTYIFETSEYLTDEAIEKFNIPIIPDNTTILSFKMTVGKLTITTEEMLSNEAIAHLKLKENSFLSSEYIYCYLKNLDFNALGSTSSIVTAINSTMIKEINFIVPKKEEVEKFNKLIKPIFALMKDNLSQEINLNNDFVLYLKDKE